MIRNYLLKTLGVVAVILISLSIFFIEYSVTIEGYNRFSPWIDTKTTDYFTEEKFDLITVGMDTTEIKDIIGEPLYRQSPIWIKSDSISQVWDFTSDGKFKKGDFAWFARELYINRKGKVSEILKYIAFD